jgi:hypothetical protein
MRVRYDRRIGIACIVIATILGTLAVASGRISFVGTIAPVAFLGFGVAFLVRPFLGDVGSKVRSGTSRFVATPQTPRAD